MKKCKGRRKDIVIWMPCERQRVSSRKKLNGKFKIKEEQKVPKRKELAERNLYVGINVWMLFGVLFLLSHFELAV